MQEIRYPYFKKDRILKISMLENLRDFPRDVLDIFCEDMSDGIVCGFTPTVNQEIITISKGIIKYHGVVYVMSEPINISYHETEKDVMLKLCFCDEIQEKDYKINDIQINIDDDMNLLPNQIELGRFRLKKGAYLRSEYQDLYDFTTEYNTINIVHVKYAGQHQHTLNKTILQYFAKEAFTYQLKDGVDITCWMLCLNSQKVERAVIQQYIAYNMGELPREMSNAEIHKQLVKILQEIRKNSKMVEGQVGKEGITGGEPKVLKKKERNALAKGGSGDILAGYACGTLARGLGAFDAVVCACYTLGLSAEISSEEKTDFCATAYDIIRNLHVAVKRITQKI